MSKLDIALAADAVPQPVFTVGPLGGLVTPLINALGMNPFVLPVGGISYNFSGGAPTTQGIYNLINELPYKPLPTDINTCKNAQQAQCRTAFMLSTGYGALGATSAIRGLIDQALGKTSSNLDPLKPATGTGMTQVSPIYLNNILRPNGGFDARFPMLVEPFGVSASMPPTGEFGPNKNGSSVYNWITDFTWPYNTLADFPIAPNPIAIANSIFGAIPPPSLINAIVGLVSGGGGGTAALIPLLNETAGTVDGPALCGAISLPPKVQCPGGACTGWADLGALLALAPLTGDLPGQALKQYLVLNYTAYDRTFATPVVDKPTTFSWSGNPAMTQAEMDAVPGNVGTALTDAFKAQAAKPYFGIIVPNPDVPPAPTAAVPAAAAVAAPVQEAAPAVVDIPSDVVDTPPAVDAPDNGGSAGHSARGAKSGNNDNAGGGTRGHRGSRD